MQEQLKTEEYEPQHVQVLNHWQVFVVRPTGPCFLPRPGPSFRIFIGMSEHGSRIVRTNAIEAFDAITLTGRCVSGELYQLGPKVGFTENMLAWFKRQHFLMAAGAADKTNEVLCHIKHAQPSKAHIDGWPKSSSWL
jgi:hypothetical protein